MSPPLPHVRCRQIGEGDIEQILNLLMRGFGNRGRDFWVRALKRLSEHPSPPGFPKYGYLLDSGGVAVGVMLLIFSSIVVDGVPHIRCSVSSWYVEPAFRIYGAMLDSQSRRHKTATYFNITPARQILPILEAQGYARYCSGRFIAVPALAAGAAGVSVELLGFGSSSDTDLPPWEIELLRRHAGYDCISLICRAANGSHPFVFRVGHKLGLLPYAQLAYCRRLEDFVRFAGTLGRFLARRGLFLVVLDADGPIAGLTGWYSNGFPKYFKGPAPPRLGDIAYSERVMFGF